MKGMISGNQGVVMVGGQSSQPWCFAAESGVKAGAQDAKEFESTFTKGDEVQAWALRDPRAMQGQALGA